MSITPSGRVRAGIEWENLEALVRALERTIPRQIKQVIEIALIKTGSEARDRAKHLVTVDTGALRRSIRLEVRRREGKTHFIGIGAGGFVRNPRTGRLVDYAAIIEFGSVHQRPQPFIRPAMRWAQNNRLKRNIWEAMARIPG